MNIRLSNFSFCPLDHGRGQDRFIVDFVVNEMFHIRGVRIFDSPGSPTIRYPDLKGEPIVMPTIAASEKFEKEIIRHLQKNIPDSVEDLI